MGYTCASMASRSSTLLNLRYIVAPSGANTCSPTLCTIVDATPSTYITFDKIWTDLNNRNIAWY